MPRTPIRSRLQRDDLPLRPRVGVLMAKDREFYRRCRQRGALRRRHRARQNARLGDRRVRLRALRRIAALLYDGPWVAERLAAIEPFLRRQAGGDRSDRARPDRRRAALLRRGCVQRPVSAEGAAARCASVRPKSSTSCCCRPRRPSIRSRRCWPIRCGSMRSSGATPISSILARMARDRRAGRLPRRWPAVRRDADRAGATR